MGKFKDLTGMKFNSWTVLKKAEVKYSFAVWECICDCGNKGSITSVNLTRGKSKSCINCGSRKRALERREPLIGFAFKYFIKYNARHRRNGLGVDVNLTPEDWYLIAKNNCFYCDTPPTEFSPYKYKDESIFVNGLDRINSNLGYSVGNCVACCKDCNIAKSTLTQEQFFNKVKQIYEKHFQR